MTRISGWKANWEKAPEWNLHSDACNKCNGFYDVLLQLPIIQLYPIGIVQSLMAAGLLIAGGLKPLQIISIAAAFPFIFIMLFACVSLVKALKTEDVS